MLEGHGSSNRLAPASSQQRRARRKLHRLAMEHFACWWKEYKDKDCPARDALAHWATTQDRRIKLADLLWQQGYRHGDHVLVYDPAFDAFREQILTRFDNEAPLLMDTHLAAQWAQGDGARVKPESRTQRKSQPDLSSHEISWLDRLDLDGLDTKFFE